jgi:hypothetical protein
MKNMLKPLLGGLMMVIWVGIPQGFAQTVGLTKAEKDNLVFMVQEEKMARDVYMAFDEKWSDRIFDNISRAEQIHLNRLRGLIERYELELPASVKSDERGVFDNKTLQKMYDKLVAEGRQSFEKALTAAAKVEETDIRDLQTAIEVTEKSDILLAYQQLLKASEQHLRAFTRNLKRLGVNYQPTVLDQETYDAILLAKPGRAIRTGAAPGWRYPNCPRRRL